MYGETQHGGMQCSEFDLLLTDALDGMLSGEDLQRFEAHRTACINCQALLADAKAGLSWLQGLEEIEPPRNLVHNILVATVGEHLPPQPVSRKPVMERLRESAPEWLAPVFGTVLQPRFAMSFGMAFFSITLLLNVAGVKLSSIRNVDLRPSNVVKTYYETQARLVKYYENLRLVVELESRLQDFKRATQAADDRQQQQQQQPKQDENQKDKGKGESDGQEEQKQIRNHTPGQLNSEAADHRVPATATRGDL